MPSHSEAARDFLHLSLVPALGPVYVVGHFANRITFSDQQARSLNLVWALIHERRIERNSRVAVVGAGIAGVTAASALALQGYNVTVFEKEARALTLQEGSSRWIHPNIYDWPAEGWREPNTRFPCMNWSANQTARVIRVLRDEWKQHFPPGDSRLRIGIAVTRMEKVGDRSVSLFADSENLGEFDCVLCCDGFGVESACEQTSVGSYWRDDDLHQALPSGGRAFVSGVGDGGLVDTLRILLQDYQHEFLLEFADVCTRDTTYVQRLLAVERDEAQYPDGTRLTSALNKLDLPPEAAGLLGHRVNPHATVVLNHTQDGGLRRHSCLLNRVLVAALARRNFVTFQPGRLVQHGQETEKYWVKLEGVGRIPQLFELLVVRHGPRRTAAAYAETLVQALRPAIEFFRAYNARADATRVPIWDDHFLRAPEEVQGQASAGPARRTAERRALTLEDGQRVQTAFRDAARGTQHELVTLDFTQLGKTLRFTLRTPEGDALEATVVGSADEAQAPSAEPNVLVGTADASEAAAGLLRLLGQAGENND